MPVILFLYNSDTEKISYLESKYIYIYIIVLILLFYFTESVRLRSGSLIDFLISLNLMGII
jgi:hypothetical protein